MKKLASLVMTSALLVAAHAQQPKVKDVCQEYPDTVAIAVWIRPNGNPDIHQQIGCGYIMTKQTNGDGSKVFTAFDAATRISYDSPSYDTAQDWLLNRTAATE